MAHLPVRVLGSSSALPARRLTTGQVLALSTSTQPPDLIRGKTGIDARHWTSPGETMAELAAEALAGALDQAGLEAAAVKRLIFVNSTGGDQLLPPTSNLVMKALGLAGSCDCFDLNNACMGFLTALDLAARSVTTGLEPVAVVVVEFLSRFIRADDTRPFVVFGDAAAAAILGPATGDEGVLGLALSNDPTEGGSIWLSHPSVTGDAAETIRFLHSNANMGEIALGALIGSAREVLRQSGLTLDDVDWFVPHQPNGRMLDKTLDALQIPEGKIVRVVDQIGSVGAAAMAVSFDRLRRERPVKAGDRVLFAGVGTGVAGGALLLQS